MTSEAAEATSSEPEGFIARTLGWLRAGYPQGVPKQDYVALLGILRRVMTRTELEGVVRELSVAADTGDALITRAMVEERIEDVLKGPAMPEDVARVSAHLAEAGWPLWQPAETSAGGNISEVRPNLVSRVVDWLRKGYPSGLPAQDFVPLVALLRRRLTDSEVTAVAQDLVESGTLPAGRIDVGAAIAKVTSELPSDEDVERVRAYLVDQGWPTDFTA